ncbi:MAG: valine--tRNA ligase [Candidatus Omnitrophica bacterium]|nr:valine--tRNA ligase [Candidatus Omnitrophota bacterium]MDD5592627.1 valine--tRNA ligase [Candidatus Omnitrophota bacterium]
MNELPSRYNPKETEDKWYKFWEENNLFSAKANPAKKPFSIVIPPPNVTGILHMGHALNNSIQDILIRYHRMKGEESLWMPGTDHAGIATQNVVEKAIAKENLKRQDLGREKFIEKVWEWREQYGSTIIHQLKKLGASCDWQRIRFTMDKEYSEAVIEVFVRLYEKGLIYRGSYIINWCPRCQTALSDEEAPHRELQGNLYYLRYPFKGQSPKHNFDIAISGTVPYIVVATTRPETMLGDTAVAVNPKDKRYKSLIGKTLILPLVNREIKIIADSMVDMKFGTGAVKVTPAHDPNDYALGKKYNLEFINIMYPDGRLNDNAGDYKDMDRFEAREVILEDLKEKGLLEKIQPHQLSSGHCYRCHTIIEPYLSKQWFVKMKPLAKPAIEAVKKGKIKFHPKRWMKVYLNWMENIQDWCISRQIWWGHRLPVYYCKNCEKQGLSPQMLGQLKTKGTVPKNDGVIVSKTKPGKCPDCNSTDIYQDEDVLDTWFSSWLWPFATFYWPVRKGQSPSGTDPVKDLKYFYPTSVLVTAPEIIFFWVARMIMAGLEFMREMPFKDVYIHGTVRDIEGKKMSKSLGNIIDPLDIINEYGADALRFSLISITAEGQDIFLSQERFEQGRNFANKIWNASRFILMNLEQGQSPAGTVPVKTDLCEFFRKEDLGIINRWILSRFYSVLKGVNKNLDNYKFNEAANLLYAFFWHEFCDWYLEIVKTDIKNKHNQVIMYKVLEKSLRIMHPFMPFITEEIWQILNRAVSHEPVSRSIMVEPWPHIQENLIDRKAESWTNTLFEVINAIRNMRAELEIPLQDKIDVQLYITNKEKKALLESLELCIRNLAGLKNITFKENYSHSPGQFSAVLKDIHVVIPLGEMPEGENYQKKIGQKISRLESEIKAKENILANGNFTKRAPIEIVEKEKMKLKDFREMLKKLKAVKDGF